MSALRDRVAEQARRDIEEATGAFREAVLRAAGARPALRETAEAWVVKVRRELGEGVQVMLDQLVRQNPQAFEAALPPEVLEQTVAQMAAALRETFRQVLEGELRVFEREIAKA